MIKWQCAFQEGHGRLALRLKLPSLLLLLRQTKAAYILTKPPPLNQAAAWLRGKNRTSAFAFGARAKANFDYLDHCCDEVGAELASDGAAKGKKRSFAPGQHEVCTEIAHEPHLTT